MKAFVFKPNNEFIGKFDVASINDVPTAFEMFMYDKKSAPIFSYVEVSGMTWTIVSQQPFRLQDGTVKGPPPPEQPSDTTLLSVGKILRAIIGFFVGSGLTLMILAAIFEGMGSATGSHYSPRGGGWFFLIIGAGVGCARLFMLFDLKFFQGLSPQTRGTIQPQPEAKAVTATDASVPHSEMEPRLARLKSLFDKGLITETDYDTRRREILSEL